VYQHTVVLVELYPVVYGLYTTVKTYMTGLYFPPPL